MELLDNWIPKCGDQKSSLGWRTTVGKTYMETKEEKVTGLVMHPGLMSLSVAFDLNLLPLQYYFL